VSAKPKVLVTRQIPSVGLEMMREVAEMEVWPQELPPPYETLLERARGKAGLVTLLTDRVDAQLMDAAGEGLVVISQFAVGVDNIDLAEATRRGVPVGHTPGALTEATADFTWALLLAAARRVLEGDRFVREGRWKTWGPQLLLGVDVYGATLGIIGLGRIGAAVARRARGFAMQVLYHDRRRKPDLERQLGVKWVSFSDLLRRSDFISLHTPLNDSTYHLIGAEELAQMKPQAILINCARGGVLDPQALYQALKEGRIRAAALDVTEPEPLPADSPLLDLPNLIIAPHMASASKQARDAMARMAAENLIAGLRGERLPYCANPEVYQG